MKAGLTLSASLHAALLGFGLLTLSAPRAFEVADVEAFPVDIIPMEEITQVQQGERQAALSERAAPTPTQRPEQVEDARNAGDNTVDLQTPPTPEPSPREVRAASVPEPSPEPAPRPTETPAPEPARAEPAPVPATELTPEPQPRQEVLPDPTPEPSVAEAAEAETEAVRLPERAPVPTPRPQPPQAQTARAPERRDSERPAERPAQPARSEERRFDADEVAALIDRQQPSGGGAQRSTQEASLGSSRPGNAARLTQSEIDGLRSQVSRCWSPPVGAAEAENLVVSIRLRLSPSGELDGAPQIVAGGGGSVAERAAAEAARRAVMRCAPYNAPADKYEAWADVQFNFDPRDMF